MKKHPIHRLLIISHVVHYQSNGKLYAYGPYAREIELWADLFPEVVIASPMHKENPPGDCIAFNHTNISISPQPERGGIGLKAKLILAISLPRMFFSLCRIMIQADAIHIRCPGNLGMLGALLSPLFSPYRIAKYAGQWSSYPGESATNWLQRKILKSNWWGAPVTVYGDWPDQPEHIISFFTSLLTDEQIQRARKACMGRIPHVNLRILYVGRLTKSKNVHILIQAICACKNSGIKIICRIIGDGPEITSLRNLSNNSGCSQMIKFTGGISYEEVIPLYEWADVLVLASETEGWPKAITEAMAFGLVCIGANRGLVPQILGEGRGIVVEPGKVEELIAAIHQIGGDQSGFTEISKRASAWSQKYSLNNLRRSLRQLMIQEWDLDEDALLPIPVSTIPD